MGIGAEDTRGRGVTRLAECGTNGAGSPTTSRHCGPTFAQINLMNGERSRPPNPGLQLGEIKPQTSD